MQFLKTIILLFFVSFIALTTGKASNIIPDLSHESDEKLRARVQGGLMEFVLGSTLQVLAPYTPKISTSKHYHSDFLAPKTVKGMGTVMIIDGSKEVFFSSNELYSRFRKNAPLLKRGGVDLLLASLMYVSSGYVGYLLGPAYFEFGGEVAFFTTYTILATRGLLDTCSALKQEAQQADVNVIRQWCTDKVKSFWQVQTRVAT